MRLHVLIVWQIAIIAKIQSIVIDAMKDILGMLQLKLVIPIFINSNFRLRRMCTWDLF